MRKIAFKKCETCKNLYWRMSGVLSDKQWNLQRFCSRKCFSPVNSKYKLGKPGKSLGMERSNAYQALHVRFKKKLPKPSRCPGCGKAGWLDLCNISQKYLNEISDWKYLCRRCHMLEDGRLVKAINTLVEYNSGK